jgi:hypothetical protein
VIGLVVVGPPVTRDGARAAARRELSKGIYHRYDDPWPVRVFNAVERWISRALDAAARHSPGGGAGALALIVLVVVVVGIAMWRVGLVRREAVPTGTVLPDRATTAADYRTLAEAAAAAGRWEDAVIARMRALAREVEERGLLDPRPGRTADELATELATGRPDSAAQVRAAANTFDAVAYGGRPAGADSYEVVAAADRSLHENRRLLAGRPR